MNTVLITGASGGLGKELALLYARDGHDLVLVARRGELLEGIKTEIESNSLSRVIVIPADLSRLEAPQEICGRLKELGVEVSVLVNNAGVGLYGGFLDADPDALRTLYQVNLMAPISLMRLLLPGMLARNKGLVVNVASLGAFFPGPLMAAYFAAKADLCSLTMALARELKSTSVRLTLACPGPFKSGFQDAAFGPKRDRNTDRRLPTAAITAQEIFKGIMLNKTIIIPGLRNNLIYLFSRILPRGWFIEAVFQAQKCLDRPFKSAALSR